jgi:hypothetical protein
MKLTLAMTGTRPMLQHSSRLANPLDPYARALKALTAKRRRTDEEDAEIMRLEARGGCWETPEGLLGVPTAAAWRSIKDAATAFRLGKDVERALLYEDVVVPLIVTDVSDVMVPMSDEGDVETVSADDWIAGANVDYRSVKMPGTGRRVMRARPIIPAGWRCTHTFELLEDVINARDLAPVLQRAGRLVGIGDWRPTYGTYEVEVLDDEAHS